MTGLSLSFFFQAEDGIRDWSVTGVQTCALPISALHVPSIGLVISGDAVYNNTHPYLAECDEQARGEWLRALDTIEALHPRAVVAGHGVLDPDSSPRHIGETRNYIRDFNTSVASTSTAMELYEKMLTLHPNRVNPGSLWGTAKIVKPAA